MFGFHNFYIHYRGRAKSSVLSYSAAATLLLLPPISSSAQNLITNGDFETPPFAPSLSVSGWNVLGTGKIHSIQEGSTTPTHSAALNVGGSSQGSILSQSFATTAGQLYVLDFDAAIFGTPDGTDLLTLNVQVNGNGPLVNDTLIPPAANTFDPSLMTFRHYQYTFRADSSTTTLQFTDAGLGNTSADTIIDTVSVVPTPTPAVLNLVNNGSFEATPYDTIGTVNGWTVGGNGNVGATGESATAGSHCASFSAGADIDGNTLSQTIATVPGKQYSIDFDTGVFGPANGPPLQLNLSVNGNAALLNTTVTPPAAHTFDGNLVLFDHYHFTFNSDSALTTITFTDIGTGNPSTDVIVDNVVVPQISLLTNGNFETGPFDTVGMISGWTVSGGGKVENKVEGSTTPSHSAALGTGGSPPGNILGQSFPTVSGKIYSLDFDASVFGVHSGSPLQIGVKVIGTGSILDQVITPPEAGTYNAAQMIFQHYHYNFFANSSTTTLQFQDIGTGGAGADTVVDTVSVLQLQPYTFNQWQLSNFNVGQRGNPSISGWTADPDNDGIKNGLEYFFNADPIAGITVSDSARLPRVSITTSGASRFLTLSYRRLIGSNGTPETIDVSDNLVSWDNTQTQIEQVGSPVLSGDGLTETVTVRLKTPINQGPIPKKFLRISVTQ